MNKVIVIGFVSIIAIAFLVWGQVVVDNLLVRLVLSVGLLFFAYSYKRRSGRG